MNHFLRKHSSFIRLKEEYEKYGKLIIAVDFDDTVFGSNQYINEKVAALLKRWQDYAEIIIWSCRTEEDYDYILRICAEAGFIPDKINEPSSRVDFGSRKIYANALLDDRAGLRQVYKDLKKLINWIEEKDVRYNNEK